MACHVTASPNHETHRETPLKYRFDVAMTGRLGFELNPRRLSADEVAFAKRAVEDYKLIRPIVQLGDLYRLVSPYEKPYASLLYVDEMKSRAVLFVLGLDRDGSLVDTLSLSGLDPDAYYTIKEINRGKKLHARHSVCVSGRELLEHGLETLLFGRYDSAVFEISRR